MTTIRSLVRALLRIAPLLAVAGVQPLTLSAVAATPLPDDAAADVIFYDGDLLTMEGADWSAQAIALKGEKILAVGSNDVVLALSGERTRVVDLGGRTLMPGFVDAHAHSFEQSYFDSANGDFASIQAANLSLGKTTMGEAFVTPEMVGDFQAFDASGALKVRLSLYLIYSDNCGVLQGDWYLQYPPTYEPGEMLRIGGVKIFADGGSCGGPALSYDHPFIGHGDLWFTQEQLNEIVRQVDAQGYQMLIHALGDRAVDEVMNAYELLLADKPNPLHHRIDHNAVLRPDMLRRYSQIDVVPVIFGAYPACNPKASPPPIENQPWEWPWRALLDANPGVRFAWHSDYPVTPASPLLNLYSLVTLNEADPNGIDICPTPDWLAPNKLLTVREVLPMMTINAAYALNRENEVGSLKAGKYADLIILSDNPTTVDPEAIKDIQVWMTMVGGEVVYCDAPDERLCLAPEPTPPPASNQDAIAVRAFASNELHNTTAAMAIDGDLDTIWNAGAPATQWIEIDLGDAQTIRGVRLTIAQYPAGETIHRIYARSEHGGFQLLHEFHRSTHDGQALEFELGHPVADVRYLRVETIQSPSWVAWREIEIIN